MVPRERFNLIYGNETGEEKGEKTTFIEIQNDVTARYGLKEKNRTKSTGFNWKTIINATAVNKATGVDFSKQGQGIPGSINTTPLRGQSNRYVKRVADDGSASSDVVYGGYQKTRSILGDIFNYKEETTDSSSS